MYSKGISGMQKHSFKFTEVRVKESKCNNSESSKKR